MTKEGNLSARKLRAYAFLAAIRSILTEIPIGSRNMEIGLALREACLTDPV